MEAVQVCEVPLPAPKRQEQHYLRKDRSWEKAEQQAQEIRESWDPVKQKLRELDELKQAQELGEVTITYALERWLASVKAVSDSGNEHTQSKYQTAAKHIGAWARSNHLIRLTQITPDALDHWKSLWSPKAKNPNDRIGKTTAGRRLEKVKRFLNYCVKMRWLAVNPAAELKAIKPDPSVTWPLLWNWIAVFVEVPEVLKSTVFKLGRTVFVSADEAGDVVVD